MKKIIPTTVTKTVTVSSLFRDLIMEGKSNKEATDIVKSKISGFGTKKTHDRYAAWYRSKMKSDAKDESVAA